MMKSLWILAMIMPTIVALGCSSNVRANDTLPDQMREWASKPELAQLQVACASSIRYATGLADLSSRGASINAMLQWGVQEAARTAASAIGKTPEPDLIALGAMMSITQQIRLLRFGQPIYSLVQGGFPQWIYRSCLKGDPVDVDRQK